MKDLCRRCHHPFIEHYRGSTCGADGCACHLYLDYRYQEKLATHEITPEDSELVEKYIEAKYPREVHTEKTRDEIREAFFEGIRHGRNT